MIKSIEKIFIVVIVSLIFGIIVLNYSYATSTQTNNAQKSEEQTSTNLTQTNESGYTSTGDKVYATEKLNVRKSADSKSEKLGSLSKNASTKRIAVGNNGWDKIEFNGGIGYVVSKYLTTQQPEALKEPKGTSTGDTVYSKKSLNVRSGWGTSYESIGGLVLGQKIQRIATGDNGWDKIKYEGKEAYVMSQYLTTSKSEVDKLVKEEKEKKENEIVNNAVSDNNIVENTNIVNNTVEENTVSENKVTNEEMYNQIVDEIGVLPQVGRSIVDYIFYMVVIAGIVSTIFVGLQIHGKNKE